MSVVINGTTGITNPNSMTIGNGGGSVATNTAVGASALAANTTGDTSVAVGASALAANTTASRNVAVGYQAGYASNGAGNVFVGWQAGVAGTHTYSTFVGYNTGGAITSATSNTCVGVGSGASLTTGSTNTFIGGNAAAYGAGGLMTTGSKNTIIGAYSGNQGGLDIRTASNYIVLSDGDGNARLYFDNTGILFSPPVYTTTTANAANMYVHSNGAFYRSTSALKYKQDVRDLEEMDISLLRAVRYKSKGEGDDQTKDYFGLIADEAAEAGFEELVTRGADGEVEGFQYERLTVVLLKSLQTLKAEFDAYKAAHP